MRLERRTCSTNICRTANPWKNLRERENDNKRQSVFVYVFNNHVREANGRGENCGTHSNRTLAIENIAQFAFGDK